MEQPKVFIILLNYNGYEDTIQCMESLEKIDYENYEVVIVDNKSTNESLKKLTEYIEEHKTSFRKKHTLIPSKNNHGFAAGNNIGIKYALKNQCDFVVLINTDTLVKKDFLKELTIPFENSDDVGISTGKIYYESKRDTFWFAGGTFNEERFYGAHIGQGEKDLGQYDEQKNISFCTGCLMMIKREVLEKVGFLSEEYFMYYEDVDYCLKVRELGYKIAYAPKAIIYHKVSASTGGEESPFAIEWNTRNRLRLMRKFKDSMTKMQYIKRMSFFYITRVIVLGKYLLKGKVDLIKAVVKGITKR